MNTSGNIYESYEIFITNTYIFSKKLAFNTNSHLKNIINIKGSLIIILKLVNVMDDRLFKTTFL